MYAIDIPLTVSFDGADIEIKETMLFSDRVVYHEEVTADIPLNPGRPLGDFVQSFIEEWGFNPFSVIKQYMTNGSVSFDPDNPGSFTNALKIFDIMGIDFDYMPTTAGGAQFSNLRINDGTAVLMIPASPYILNSAYWLGSSEGAAVSRNTLAGDPRNSDRRIYFSMMIYPERCYNSGKFLRSDLYDHSNCKSFYGELYFEDPRYTSGEIILNRVTFSLSNKDMPIAQRALIDALNESDNNGIIQYNPNDPYTRAGTSTTGGGNGTGRISSDTIPDPDEPDIDAITTGLITVFRPTLSQINSLGNYLWSNAFDVDTLKKLFGDPMQAIIGLSIIPIIPPASGTKSVKIGNVDTEISMPYIGRQFVTKQMGSVTIDPFIGSFMDYSPYTKISIYLPYIGFRELSAEDVMGTTLTVKYIIDVITGGCNAVVNVSGKGAIYQFNGSCIANVPLSAINYSGAIQNAISAVGSGITAIAGFASGAAPVGLAGVAGLATNAANTAVNSKPTIQRSGAMGGAAGLCSVQFPYVVIERPRPSVPASINEFHGNMLNVTMNLSQVVGFTMIQAIHLDDLYCTETERDELMSLLQKGVIL